MTRRPTTTTTPQELAYRVTDGLEVSLLWSEADGLTVAVRDSRTDDSFELAVEGDDPLDVFNHPYAYAAFRGVAYRVAATPSSSASVEARSTQASMPSSP